MSFHYWHNRGQGGKRRFLTLTNSYHGETLGALSVGDVALYREIYQPLLLPVITVPSPDCYLRAPGESWAEHSRRSFAAMEAALRAPRRRTGRRDRRAAGAVRRRHAHVRSGLSAPAARGLRSATAYT